MAAPVIAIVSDDAAPPPSRHERGVGPTGRPKPSLTVALGGDGRGPVKEQRALLEGAISTFIVRVKKVDNRPSTRLTPVIDDGGRTPVAAKDGPYALEAVPVITSLVGHRPTERDFSGRASDGPQALVSIASVSGQNRDGNGRVTEPKPTTESGIFTEV